MANDGGMTAKIEEAIVALLKPLQFNGKDAFETVKVWDSQIKGPSDFAKYQPFAFVGFFPFSPGREGDFDLREDLRFAILIGIETTKKDDSPRNGSATKLGASLAREIIIEALDGKHPTVDDGGKGQPDDLTFFGEEQYIDSDKLYATELQFKINWIPTQQ